MSVMGIRQCLRRIGDLFERHQTGQEAAKAGPSSSRQTTIRGIYASSGASASKCGFAPPRRCRACHRLALSAARQRCAQSGDAHAQDQPPNAPNAAQPNDAAKDNQRKTDEFAEAAAGHQRAGRQPRMRLARPPRGATDVARRPRYRVPPPRSLRPFWLPRRPCPGDVPLPDPVWRSDRPQGRRNPQ